MKKLSTKNLDLIPKANELQKICKAISALEAVLSPEWEYRYYSYQKDWDEGEEFCEMRNGEGDKMLILFNQKGAIINGFAHESSMNGWKRIESQNEPIQEIWKGVTDNLPEDYHEFVFGEPVRSTGTTFCIWFNKEENVWKIGEIEFPKDNYLDGSHELLELLDGNPETYKNWAEEYYEKENLELELIRSIFEQNLITEDLVKKLNPELENLNKLKSDLEEIGFEYKL